MGKASFFLRWKSFGKKDIVDSRFPAPKKETLPHLLMQRFRYFKVFFT